MIERFALRGIEVSQERTELEEMRQKAALLSSPAKREELFFDVRLAKRRLMFRDPELSPLEHILFVKRQSLRTFA